MRYKYNGFIPQSIAPKDAVRIGLYDSSGKRIGTVPLGHLTPVKKTKLYSVGLVSDVHFGATTVGWNPSGKFDKALTYFESENCAFVANSGDNVQTGFYRESAPDTFDASQFALYKQICDAHEIDIYEIAGNHESYVKAITTNLTEYKDYTGADLYYSVSQGDDLYLFLGQPKGNTPMTDEALQWLYETLEVNRNKRCFIFVHPHITNDSGNATNIYTSNPIFDWWGTKTTVFKNLLSHYKNTILFHGHTHMMFECQEVDEAANYTEKNGFRSIHIPSLSRPCAIIDGVRTYQDDKSYGYLMDVYDDCIVLNGRDFVNDEWIPTGTFKIYTPLVKISAGTFTDSTGIITD